MKATLTKVDAQAIRAEIDARHGYPRQLEAHEIQHVGGDRHVEEVWTTTAVAIDDEGDEATVTVDDDDEKHVEPERRARLRAAKEPAEERRDPEGKKR